MTIKGFQEATVSAKQEGRIVCATVGSTSIRLDAHGAHDFAMQLIKSALGCAGYTEDFTVMVVLANGTKIADDEDAAGVVKDSVDDEPTGKVSGLDPKNVPS